MNLIKNILLTASFVYYVVLCPYILYIEAFLAINSSLCLFMPIIITMFLNSLILSSHAIPAFQLVCFLSTMFFCFGFYDLQEKIVDDNISSVHIIFAILQSLNIIITGYASSNLLFFIPSLFFLVWAKAKITNKNQDFLGLTRNDLFNNTGNIIWGLIQTIITASAIYIGLRTIIPIAIWYFVKYPIMLISAAFTGYFLIDIKKNQQALPNQNTDNSNFIGTQLSFMTFFKYIPAIATSILLSHIYVITFFNTPIVSLLLGNYLTYEYLVLFTRATFLYFSWTKDIELILSGCDKAVAISSQFYENVKEKIIDPLFMNFIIENKIRPLA